MKYKLGNKEGNGLCRVIALIDFSDVKAGEIGGYVGGEENLSQEDDCWVYENTLVYENAKVSGNALVCGTILDGESV